MASTQQTADFILEQIESLGDVRVRKMFGEYALYYNDKVVAFICDDQLFMKPTDAAKNYAEDTVPAPPYPGAKDYYRVNEDKLEDSSWLCQFVADTAAVLPLPKPKKSSKG